MCHGQTSKNWTWGLHAGLKFGKNLSSFQTSKLYSFYISTICDSLGNNLIYSNYSGIFDRNQDMMPNGSRSKQAHTDIDIGPVGSVIIPQHNNRFFIFNVWFTSPGKIAPVNNGLYYSIVDLSRHNGLGDVDSSFKDVRILWTEIHQLYALQNNAGSYWLIARTRDTSYAYPVDSKGIHPPVITYTPEAPGAHSLYIGNAFEISHDHKFAVSCRSQSVYNDTNIYWIYGYDFDQSSGIFSNQRLLKYGRHYSPDGSNDDNYAFYDVAFSPNDSLYYLTNISNYGLLRLPLERYIVQMQRYGNDTAGRSFYLNVTNELHATPSGIKLGPDKKIYVMFYDQSGQVSSLAIVNKPDKTGPACNLVLNQVAKNLGGAGFPFEAASYIAADFRFSADCSPRFINKSSANFRRFTWYFGDGDSSSARDPVHYYHKSGKYPVALKALTRSGYESWQYDTIHYFQKPKASFSYSGKSACQWAGIQFKDYSTCDTFNLNTGRSWLWDFGDGSTDTARNPVHVYTKSGVYTVMLIFSNGFCFDTAVKKQEINILPAPKPGLSLLESKFCAPARVHVIDRSVGKVSAYRYTYTDTGLDTISNPVHDIKLPGIFWIKQQVTGATGCIASDSIPIIVSPGVSQTDTPAILFSSVDGNNHIKLEWNSVKNTAQYILSKSIDGQFYSPLAVLSAKITSYTDYDVSPQMHEYWYKLTSRDSCGHNSADSKISKTILLHAEAHGNDFAVLKWTPYEDWPQNMEYQVIAGQTRIDSASRKQLDFTDFFFLQDSQVRKCYTICAVNKVTGAKSYSNQVCIPYKPVIWIPNAFTPNKDGHNDRFTVKATGLSAYAIKIYDRWGEMVYSSTDIAGGWDGRYKNAQVPDGTYIYKIEAKGAEGQEIYYSGHLKVIW